MSLIVTNPPVPPSPVGLYDSASIQFLPSGTGATSRTAQDKLREVSLSIMDFGGDNTGATDQTAALVLALNKAFSSATLTKNYVIDFPQGDYLFTQANPFGSYSVSTAARQFVRFRSSGGRITFRPGGSSDAYLYDGSTGSGTVAADNQLLLCKFHGFHFVFDETGMSGGTLNVARLFPKSGAPNQDFEWHDCYFQGPTTVARAGKVLVINGTINGSENKFFHSRATAMAGIISSTNPQAVNNYVFGCDWESMVGDIYYFNGGGQLTHIGGSLIYGSTLATDSYIINCDAPAGGLTSNFNFYGVRSELNDANGCIANLAGTNCSAQVTFRDSTFDTVTGGTRTAVSVQPNAPASITFDRCSLNSASLLYAFKNGTLNYHLGLHYGGEMVFKNCKVPKTFPSLISWGTNSVGMARSRGCYMTSSYATGDGSICLDFDLTGSMPAHSFSSKSQELKTYHGLIYTWPDTATPDSTNDRIVLPAGVMVKKVWLVKRAIGSETANYQLALVNQDGTYTYGTSTISQQKTRQEILVNDVGRVAASGVDQTIRVIATKTLAYNTQTANFTVGATLTDATTLTTAKILADVDGGATGTLTIGLITGGSGAFGVGNIISDGSGGSATCGATTDLQGSGVSRTTGSGDIFYVEYL